ncbi:hypothetical protein CC78DRAFT_586273 [Lojkania enalia]|uniref:Uncharacterized protein n=1 Tax=Lojkania enalia TaxID=147567 RepID=A0A9P4K454_9PLEO|nr:hypothetical protein CC78DRAFT_586273 [Didymosphaeria enalia]
MDGKFNFESRNLYGYPRNPEEFSIDTLIQRVEEFQRRDHLETLEKLTEENCSLQQRILRYRKYSCLTLDILEKVYEGMLAMQKVLNECLEEEKAVEQAWLIFKEGESGWREYSSGRWI